MAKVRLVDEGEYLARYWPLLSGVRAGRNISCRFFSAGVTHITPELAFEKRNGRVTYFSGLMPVFSHDEDDLKTFRMITSQFCANGNAQNALAYSYPMGYTKTVIEIRQTDQYSKWFAELRDRQARARINVRIRRLLLGNPGDVKSVGKGVSELRIDYGPGYRVYFVQHERSLVVLLAGGDKTSQKRDIKTALKLAQEL
jgi:putative addiction module killer protein